ncbi:MAG: hypothetical protein ACRDWT_15665 [Jatrophihabitantaceae bacterium]
MRFRKLAVLAVAAIAVTGLSACNTKVGAAAYVGGHRISDSNVEQYLTPKAVPFQLSSQSGSSQTIVPRSYVLQTLILGRLFNRALADTKGGQPTESQLSAADKSLAQGATQAQQQQQYTKYGFKSSFAALDIRNTTLETILAQRTGATSDAKPIFAEISKLKIPVNVNSRYGSWSPSTFSLTSDPSAGLPSFVTIHPVATSTPTG